MGRVAAGLCPMGYGEGETIWRNGVQGGRLDRVGDRILWFVDPSDGSCLKLKYRLLRGFDTIATEARNRA